MELKAVIFDVFGTTLRIAEGAHPYRKLMRAGIKQGRRPRPEDASILMSGAYGLMEAADLFGIEVSPPELDRLDALLRAEVASIEPYTDAVLCIAALKAAGLKVGICSNLALPYGDAVTRHFPDLDAYGFSFEAGVLKPDRRIYESVLQAMGVGAGATWMVGDSQRCDQLGPEEVGIKGHLLQRAGGELADLMQFGEVALRAVDR
ncbi:haloacid dehalogenase-like family hydrolase [Pseudomonas veronii 1YdBTEX2]|uniref:Haloacid dehalogenase-like family hydrolase n=1 Tax=Pseudomonas veronii 1YdBTEX2 TaxID=1295141 RepID=A0A1D3K827_PSEVE|nr:haloacid dehalogenase-like family hydrolase [Pseudomonas veronii 1YdBTEX2]